MLQIGLGVDREELDVFPGEIKYFHPFSADHGVPAHLPGQAGAIAGHVMPLGAGVGDQPQQPVAVGHEPGPGIPAHLGGRRRGRGPDGVAVHADTHPEILENFPVRVAAAEFIVGDDFLRAGMNNVELDVPDRAVGGGLELEHRVALAGVLPVLQHPGATAVGCPGIFPKNETPFHEIIYFRIQPFDDRSVRHPISPGSFVQPLSVETERRSNQSPRRRG